MNLCLWEGTKVSRYLGGDMSLSFSEAGSPPNAQIHDNVCYTPYHRFNFFLSNALPEIYMNNRHFYLLIRFPFELNVKYSYYSQKIVSFN